ncbi:alpha/beta fold hydrolase [Herbiconiux daphne]|uniref:Alpha/beta hydrolase n=1 Tax=Herbiconiux daphne TaxID=2970914 RepID=A0ABT2H1G1_9MICO|nr:alpha/beta hydrolase [Herbiconiux daphne]MCS5733752.1 alpha/beta hydrolase [Herbiconiux daphne]
MTPITPAGATIAGVTHHRAEVNGTDLHVVSAGTSGSPILLVHGWPETWWAFRSLIPLLAETHRVYALDLRGFGDSSNSGSDFTQQVLADDLHSLVEHIGAGAVHLVSQDISGGVAFEFATSHPGDVLSFTAIESSLAGFGLELLADVNAFGSWHVGFLGTPGIPSMLLPGHERELLEGWAFPAMSATDGAISQADLDEFVRTYSRPNAWRGTEGLYRALFTDKGATRARAETHPLSVPVLAVDGANHPFTAESFRPVAAGSFGTAHIEGVGHLVAQEAPGALASVVLDFVGRVDGRADETGAGDRPATSTDETGAGDRTA